jgi:hypothetical protein
MKWAALVSRSQRPAILNQNHKDWPKLVRWVPRSWTAFIGKPPKKILGNAHALKPIPDRGTWWLGLPLYVAFQSKNGIHARLGFRWDDVDHYYNVTIQPFKHFKQ